MTPPQTAARSTELFVGLMAGLAAQLVWGFVVIYFKAVEHVPPLTFVAHRAIWSAPLMVGLVLFMRGLPRLRAMLADRPTLLLLPVSAFLLGCNWLGFVYCISSGQVLQSALAYFISPLLMAALGVIVLRERLGPLQSLGLGIATAGVVVLTIDAGVVPWLALTVGGTWSLYSLLRRWMRIPAVEGFGAELVLLLIAAVAFLAWTGWMPAGRPSPHTPQIDFVLLASSGVVTTVPLILFGMAARRLPLTTLGFIQYLGPTIQFLLAVLLYGEAFTWMKGAAYGLIWTALAVYTIDSRWAARVARQNVADATDSAAATPPRAELVREARPTT